MPPILSPRSGVGWNALLGHESRQESFTSTILAIWEWTRLRFGEWQDERKAAHRPKWA